MTFLQLSDAHLHIVGLLSMTLSLFAFLPYIYDILQGQTKPHRASWLIWAVVSTSSFLSQAYEGADRSLLFAGMQAAGATTIYLLSLQYGVGRLLDRPGVMRLFLIGIAVALSFLSKSAGFMLAACIFISAIAGLATVKKAFHAPESETLLSWFAFFSGSALALISVGHWEPLLIVFPAYLVVLYGSIIAAILFGKLTNVQDRYRV